MEGLCSLHIERETDQNIHWHHAVRFFFHRRENNEAEEPIDGNTKERETDMARPLLFLKEQLTVLATAKQILSSRDGTK